MAPEMASQEVAVTTKADVYSFGVVLWELISPNVDLIEAWVSHSTKFLILTAVLCQLSIHLL